MVVGIGGLLAVVTGLLPLAEARDVTVRLAPVLGFLAAVTVLAELADAADVFEVAAVRAARLARGSVPVLYALVVALGTLTTVLLSLDTTAVLLTPVVLALALRLGLRPLPFAITAVWLANTTSLLLPVSNLSNLLAQGRLGLSATAYAGRMILPALAALATTVLVLVVRFHRDLSGRYEVPPVTRPRDAVLFAAAALACLLFGPLVLLGVAPWLAATPLAAALALAFAVRRRTDLRPGLVPWRLLVLTEGLFLIVSAAGRHGLDHLLARLVGSGGNGRVAAVAAAGANLVNNLPAYLALERTVPRSNLLGLLAGINIGPLVLIWGSLATLLWRERCRARGVHVSFASFGLLGIVGMPIVLAATVLALP